MNNVPAPPGRLPLLCPKTEMPTTRSPRVSKRFIYQIARWLKPTKFTLQAQFEAALKALPTERRRQPITSDASDTDGTWRKLLFATRRQGCALGKLAQYTHGIAQGAIRQNPKPGEAPETSEPPPPGSQWTGGELFFCIKDNHVVIAQSQALRISALESFLNWLIGKKVKVAGDNSIVLESLPPVRARKALSDLKPKTVTMTREVDVADHREVRGSTDFRVNPTIEMLQDFLNIRDLRGMLPTDALEAGRICTSVTLSWNKRIDGPRPESFMQGMGHVLLRKLDEDPELNVTIETRSGKLTRDKLSLAKSYQFTAPGGVVSLSEVFDRLISYLADLHEDRQIAE